MKITKLVIISLSLGAIIAIISIIFVKTQSTQQPPPTPPAASPAPIQFQIESTTPQSGKQPIVFKNTAITLIFNQEIDPSTVKATITPNIGLNIEINQNNNKILYLKPKTNWVYHQNYQIILSVNSVNNQSIKNFKFIFEPQPPREDPEIEYSDYGI